jgi:branched-chain amino acid transport system substrate-binding protein
VLKVGLIVDRTGPLAAYGKNYENGFMAALDHLTDGTMKIDGHPIEVTVADSTGDAAVGTTKATEMIGDGVKVLAGPTNSAVALSIAELCVQNEILFVGGGFANSQLVGTNDLLFTPSGNTPAGVPLISTLFSDSASGKSVAAIAPDYAFGQDQVALLKKTVEPLGMAVKPYLLPTTTTDFVPTALQLKKDAPDYLDSLWVGAGVDQLFSALSSQGVLDTVETIVQLNLRSSFGAIAESLGEDRDRARLFSYYYEGATGNEDDQALAAYSKKHDKVVEHEDSIGWTGGEMVFRAVTDAGVTDAQAMAESLKDWSFEGPQGEVQIRGADNQVAIPYFEVKFDQQPDGTWFVKKVADIPASALMPPVVHKIPS